MQQCKNNDACKFFKITIIQFILGSNTMLSSGQKTTSKSQIFQNIIENEAKTEKGKVKVDELDSVNRDVHEFKNKVAISKDIRKTKTSHPVPLKNYATGQISYDTLHASEEADQVSL